MPSAVSPGGLAVKSEPLMETLAPEL